jgi:hypothetical protein
MSKCYFCEVNEGVLMNSSRYISYYPSRDTKINPTPCCKECHEKSIKFFDYLHKVIKILGYAKDSWEYYELKYYINGGNLTFTKEEYELIKEIKYEL